MARAAQARKQSERSNMVVSESIEMLDTQVYAENSRAMQQQIQRMTASKDMTDDGEGNFDRPRGTPGQLQVKERSWYLACLMYWEWHAYASLEGKLIGHGQAG